MSTAIMECREMDTIFIFAPKNAIKDVWITGIAGGTDEETGEEIPSFFKEAKNYWSITEDPEMKNVYSRKDCKYFIFNFEQIENASLLLNNMDCGKIGVILDEAHCFNEMTSKRTIDFLNFCVQSNTEDLIWATGTPIKISSTEILSSLSALTPNLSKENEKKFKNSLGRLSDEDRKEQYEYYVGRLKETRDASSFLITASVGDSVQEHKTRIYLEIVDPTYPASGKTPEEYMGC